MRAPLSKDRDKARTMSRMPCGGFAVLDIARPLRGRNQGSLPTAADCSFQFTAIRNTYSRNVMCPKLYVSSLGLGDFVAFLGDQESYSCRQPVHQIEAPSQLRIPIMHRVESGRLIRVRIEARRATVLNTHSLVIRKEVCLSYSHQLSS